MKTQRSTTGPIPSGTKSETSAHSRSAGGEVVHVRAQQGRGAAVGEQRLRGVAQQDLVLGEGKVHARGSPSTRWAMMLRWISLVPPAMVLAKLTKKLSAHRPASSPRSSSTTGPYGPWISIPSS